MKIYLKLIISAKIKFYRKIQDTFLKYVVYLLLFIVFAFYFFVKAAFYEEINSLH